MRLLALALFLALAACGKDPQALAVEALQGDPAQAEARVKELIAEHPKEAAYHMAGFVLFRHLAAQGDSARQQEFQNQAIVEYDQVAKHFKVSPDYANMENSLRTQPEAAALMDAARAPLYGR